MRPLRSIQFAVLLLGFRPSVFGAKEASHAPALTPVVLPEGFAGWQIASRAPAVFDAAAADRAEAPLLQEFGFAKLESASYEQNGRQLNVKALAFHDATGALGAFLYYRQPQMVDESIGDLSSSLNEHVLFYRGNVVIDAVFDKLTVMSASQLRELAAGLPLGSGGGRHPPQFPNHPPQKLAPPPRVPQSIHYAERPVGFARN